MICVRPGLNRRGAPIQQGPTPSSGCGVAPCKKRLSAQRWGPLSHTKLKAVHLPVCASALPERYQMSWSRHAEPFMTMCLHIE